MTTIAIEDMYRSLHGVVGMILGMLTWSWVQTRVSPDFRLRLEAIFLESLKERTCN